MIALQRQCSEHRYPSGQKVWEADPLKAAQLCAEDRAYCTGPHAAGAAAAVHYAFEPWERLLSLLKTDGAGEFYVGLLTNADGEPRLIGLRLEQTFVEKRQSVLAARATVVVPGSECLDPVARDVDGIEDHWIPTGDYVGISGVVVDGAGPSTFVLTIHSNHGHGAITGHIRWKDVITLDRPEWWGDPTAEHGSPADAPESPGVIIVPYAGAAALPSSTQPVR